MTSLRSLVVVVMWSALLLGQNAATVPISIYAVLPHETNITLECKFDEPTSECTWNGPKFQRVNSLTDYNNEEYRIRRQKDDLYCNITLTKPRRNPKHYEGVWQCRGASSSTARWRVVYAVKPKPPVITFQDDSSIPKDVNVFNDRGGTSGDIYLPLICNSNGGKPPPESISWLFNGHPPPHHSEFKITRAGELFNSETQTSLLIGNNEENRYDFFSMANVTCVVQHATGQLTVTKLFGNYDSPTVDIVRQDIPDDPKAQLIKCVPKGYPPPTNIVIKGPSGKFNVPEAIVREPGPYICSARLGVGSSMTTRTVTLKFPESNEGLCFQSRLWTVTIMAILTMLIAKSC